MHSLKELNSNTSEEPVSFRFGAQVQQCVSRITKSNKPYFEVQLVDASNKISLKIWNNHPQFDHALHLQQGQFVLVEGDFTKNKYGIESNNWSWQPLDENGKNELLLGNPELAEKQLTDWKDLKTIIAEISDPRLNALCNTFIDEFSEKFKRSAAARTNHHARRGGLVEHVAQMMRIAVKICEAYPSLNKDLLLSGILFHDSGKLWENNYPAEDFHQLHSLTGEALGHISLGIELTNTLWKKCFSENQSHNWKDLSPPHEHVRIHLLHLIASHHGTLEFGSPVVPKTPEAFVLHYIDNMDAKLEMLFQTYETGAKLNSQITEKKFPLPGNLLNPLSHYSVDL